MKSERNTTQRPAAVGTTAAKTPFVPRTRLVVSVLFAAAATFAGITLGARVLGATGGPVFAVNPPGKAQVWYQTTPITITINASQFSGPGLTPVTGYQYGLSWDPRVLRWISGPKVGPGTPTPAPVLPCSNSPQIKTWGTPTATPTGVLTWTPTSTPTPLTTTPTNTPTATFTASMTPTPGGYIQVGCVPISITTAQPSGVIGTFQFQPIATARASSPLTLLNVIAVNAEFATPTPAGSPIVPIETTLPSTTSNGIVNLVNCYDITGDGNVNGLDLGALAARFLTSVGNPNYKPVADLNSDGTINGLDLGLLASGFLTTC